MIKQYKKKPVAIEAVQFKNHNHTEIEDFCGDKVKVVICDTAWQVGKGIPHDWLEIETLEGTMRADEGDYIIKGVNGEFYPCKPDIFEKTYSDIEKDYKERLVIEFKELHDKLVNLNKFQKTDDFKKLSEEKQKLLNDQSDVMQDYENILTVRLELEGVSDKDIFNFIKDKEE